MGLLGDVEGPLQKRFRLAIASLGIVEPAQIVGRIADLGVVGRAVPR